MAYTRTIAAILGAAYTGQAGTIGATVESGATTLVPRFTAGITEEPGGRGIYTAQVAGWDEAWDGAILWDDGSGNTLAVEDFHSSAGGDLSSLIAIVTANLDATVSSRLAAADYVEPDNAGIATLLTRTITPLPAGPAANASGTDQIVRRRTYSQAAGSTHLEYEVTGIDLTGADVQLYDTLNKNDLLAVGSKSEPDPGLWLVTFDLDNSVTAALELGTRNFELVAMFGSEPAHIAFVRVVVVA